MAHRDIADTSLPAQTEIPLVRPAFRSEPLKTTPAAPIPDHWKDAGGELGTSDDLAFGPL